MAAYKYKTFLNVLLIFDVWLAIKRVYMSRVNLYGDIIERDTFNNIWDIYIFVLVNVIEPSSFWKLYFQQIKKDQTWWKLKSKKIPLCHFWCLRRRDLWFNTNSILDWREKFLSCSNRKSGELTITFSLFVTWTPKSFRASSLLKDDDQNNSSKSPHIIW